MQTINENDTPLTATNWLSAKNVMKRSVPHLGRLTAAITIATRAHAGLIKARAQLFKWEYETNIPYGRNKKTEQSAENYILPKEFWWAKGHAALKQNWVTGDFSTWIDSKYHWEAFGVEFEKQAIETAFPESAITEVIHEHRPAHTSNELPSDDAIKTKMIDLTENFGMSRDNAAKLIRQINGFEKVGNEHARRVVANQLPLGRPKKARHN
jgi:hypothetical protein